MYYDKKIEKFKEVNEALAKRIKELETHMFVKNIVKVAVAKPKEDNQDG